MAENQENVKPKEREIPVFTVLKNNCILKNIFVLDSPPPIPSSSLVLGAGNSDQESEREEILLVGRHPDCNIKLEHPSISRFHLRIHSKPSSRSLFVTDLSSVHGTCISGKRIEPGVMMELVQGDTLKLGESSRLYRLDWVPISLAYEMNDPFVPQLDSLDTVSEETEGADQDENSFSRVSDEIDVLGWQFSEEDLGLSMEELTVKEAPIPENYEVELCNKENEISCSQLSPLDASLTAEVENYEVELSNKENEIFGSQLSSLDTSLTADEETEGLADQDGDNLLHRNDEIVEDIVLSTQKMSAISLPQSEDEVEIPSSPELCRKEFSSSQLFQNHKENTPQPEDQENSGFDDICEKENEFSGVQLCQVKRENITPRVLQIVSEAETIEAFEMNSEKRLGTYIWSRRGKSESVEIKTNRNKETSAVTNCVNKQLLKDQFASPDKDVEIFTPDKENAFPNSCLVRSLGSTFDEALKSELISNTPASSVDEDEEVYTSDKENMTPNSHLFKSIKKIGSSQEVRHSNMNKPSPLKAVSRSIHPEELILRERKPTDSASRSHSSLKKQPYALKAAKREPFLPPPLISSGDDKPTSPSVQECTVRGSRSINNSKAEVSNQSHRNPTKVSENKWIVVVDTACLLSKKSRRELQLLRGLRGTSLVIPRIVVRELDCMVRRVSFLSRMTEASAALQWIEECMASTKWWIHVQSSAEESTLIPPTPTTTTSHWFNEDKGSIPFSVGSILTLQEIVTPTAADHILESALFFKQTMDGQLVLLSDDVTLKIKAMAEGVICETAKEFRASLVNPFSTRFLYSDSSPRGPTWTCVDDTVLKEKYYPSPSKKASRSGDGAKGLKLILMHNSNFRQMRAYRKMTKLEIL